MFLRSLTIRGFKSFAERTTLEFTPGISVLVGPNGSGKSNIADAIAWVLGEQGPRAMRGGQMADVIFAGSPSRPGLGMAEVKLVIDNEAGRIPVPASEIEIARAVFRSGESEYRLAGRPCRLLDIQELLSDTGMGRALHTIVGQGQLEDVLSARPEERRQMVEEAAGIAKHRRRRERAERKLAGLEQDLLRLQDVQGELRRQLKPLKHQAELAARHEALTREAAQLAMGLAAVRLRDLYGDRERSRPSWQEAERRQAEGRGHLEELDRRIELLDEERTRAEEAERQAEEGHAGAASARSDAERRFRSALEREAEARRRLARAETGSARLFALTDELDRTERALGEVRQALQGRETELAEAERAHRLAEQSRRDAEEEGRRLEAETTARRIETETLQRALASQEEERGRLIALVHDLRGRIAVATARSETLEGEVERLDALETPLAAEQTALDKERADLARAIGELEAVEKGHLARQEVLDARMIELSESPGAAFARRRGDRPIGVLRDLVGVPGHLKLALRAALGPFADAVVYATPEEAVREASAAPAGVILAGASVAPPGSGDAVEGVEPLLGLVRLDPRVRQLAALLLHRVFLVSNLAEAAARLRLHPEAQFVTPEGVVVGPHFVRTTAGADSRIQALRRDSATIERELASVRRGLRERRQRQVDVTARLDALRGELERTDGLITAAAEDMAAVQAELGAVAHEETLVSERLTTLDDGIAELRRRLAGRPEATVAIRPLPPVPEPPVHLRVDVEAHRRERSRMEAAVTRIRAEVEALAGDDSSTLGAVAQEAEAERAEAEAGLRAADERLGGALGAFRQATEAARASRLSSDQAHQAWREQAATVDRMREEHEQEHRAHLDLERRITEAERLLRQGHGCDPTEAIDGLGPEDSVESLQGRSELVARRLGLLGKVNLLATGELESLQERHDFLVRELEDVRAARRDLREVIAEVDRQVAELFELAFRDVARAYAELFAMLFPGGEGRLALTDPSDPLGSGIEVEARPGGKRVKRLSLLSGGERSLAALAFLFAIFRARPSPFYLMDEVEAALDDVNLSRFLDVIREFARSSQILVVTHQKRTMETADVLYGVSMGKDGASTVLSQRLAEVVAG